MKQNQSILINSLILPCLASIGFLIFALIDNNIAYSYFVILRWVVSITAFLIALEYFKKGKMPIAALFGIICGLYQPISKVSFDKNIWVWINSLTLIGFIILFISKLQLRKYLKIFTLSAFLLPAFIILLQQNKLTPIKKNKAYPVKKITVMAQKPPSFEEVKNAIDYDNLNSKQQSTALKIWADDTEKWLRESEIDSQDFSSNRAVLYNAIKGHNKRKIQELGDTPENKKLFPTDIGVTDIKPTKDYSLKVEINRRIIKKPSGETFIELESPHGKIIAEKIDNKTFEKKKKNQFDLAIEKATKRVIDKNPNLFPQKNILEKIRDFVKSIFGKGPASSK